MQDYEKTPMESTNTFRKKLPWMLASLLIAAATIWAVVFGTDSFSFPALMHDLKNAQDCWLVAAVAAMAGFVIFEGLALKFLVQGLSNQKRCRGWLLYSASDIYFSAITPSASGGQPASAFFMIRNGIPAAETTVILLLNLILYTVSLMLVGIVAIAVRPWMFAHLSGPALTLICIGIGILVLMAVFFFLLLRKEMIVHGLLEGALAIGTRLHIVKNAEKKKERVYRLMQEYKTCAALIVKRKKVVALALLMNLLQRLCQTAVTVCVYLAMTHTARGVIDVWCAQVLTTVGSNSIPIPGAMGVADYLLIQCLETIPGVVKEANLELLSRGISFYACVFVSMVLTVIGYVHTMRRGETPASEDMN